MLLLPLRKAGIKEWGSGQVGEPCSQSWMAQGREWACHLDWGYPSPGRELARWVLSAGSEEGGIEMDKERQAQGGSDGSRAPSGQWKAGIRLGWASLPPSRHWAPNTVLGLVGKWLLMAQHSAGLLGRRRKGEGKGRDNLLLCKMSEVFV